VVEDEEKERESTEESKIRVNDPPSSSSHVNSAFPLALVPFLVVLPHSVGSLSPFLAPSARTPFSSSPTPHSTSRSPVVCQSPHHISVPISLRTPSEILVPLRLNDRWKDSESDNDHDTKQLREREVKEEREKKKKWRGVEDASDTVAGVPVPCQDNSEIRNVGRPVRGFHPKLPANTL